MIALRLLADDLTGALDTAAEFVGLSGEMMVAWDGSAASHAAGSLALDSGTRECTPLAAVAMITPVIDHLLGCDLAYKKLDSLLRGPWEAELATVWASGHWDHCVVAPAFPFQGRRTRDGFQQVRTPEGQWSSVGTDLVTALRRVGIEAGIAPAGAPMAPGVTVFDAETDGDLASIAAIARAEGAKILWCGSGGLARAIAGECRAPADDRLTPPVLGLFGSNHPATFAQLTACRDRRLTIAPDGRNDRDVAARLVRDDAALVAVSLPDGISRQAAARQIADTLGTLASRMTPPGTLIAAGGETLRAVCLALGTQSLRVVGQVMPGVPRSVMVGGRWDGVAVVSKSGAFGPPALWHDLLAANGLVQNRIPA